MSEPVTRQRPSVDLDDFERRLHHAPAGHDDDPLAELARLVGEQRDPYEDVFAQEAVAHATHGDGAHDYAAHDYAGHQEPTFDSAQSPRLPHDFAAIEAGLRGGISPHADEPTYQDDPQYAQHDDQAYAYAAEPSVLRRAATSKRPIYLMAATIAVGVLGVGGAFALKGHGTSPSDIKTIVAAAGPTKIQPPAQTGDQNAQDSAMLGKGNQTTPTKLVSNQEEPVDVGQAVQENAARDVSRSTDASSVPVPPSPGQADGAPQVTADAAPASPAPATDFAMGMPAPKRVKVVSVRPDGTILSDDQPPAAAVTSDTQAPLPAPAAKAPKPASAAKTVSRVVPKRVAEAPVTNASDGADAPATAAPAPAPKTNHKAKPQKLAMAEPADTAPTDDTQAAAKTSGSGGFAVQLAAPGSEADARAASSKLAKKYASALDGRHLAFHKAQSNGKSVFRVRVSSLSKDEAQALCEKLKADGGSCFVAKN